MNIQVLISETFLYCRIEKLTRGSESVMDQERLDAVNFCCFAAAALVSGRIDTIDDTKTKNTSLHICATKSDPEWVRLFLNRGALPDSQNGLGNTPLHVAASWNLNDSHYDVMATLIPGYENIDIKNLEGKTPFHVVLMKSNKRVVQLFLDSGASPIEPDSTGRCPLLLGALKGDVEVLRLILDKMHQEWPMIIVRNRNAIMEAAELKGNFDCINLLTNRLF